MQIKDLLGVIGKGAIEGDRPYWGQQKQEDASVGEILWNSQGQDPQLHQGNCECTPSSFSNSKQS